MVATLMVEHCGVHHKGNKTPPNIGHLWNMVDVLNLDFFITAPTSSKIWNTKLMRDNQQNLNHACSQLPHDFFGVRTNILIIIKVKVLMHIKWSYSSPPPLQLC